MTELTDKTQEWMETFSANPIQAFVKLKMHTLQHIPMRYYMPDYPGVNEGDLQRLYDELHSRGSIHLDKDGQPACLSGKEPVIPYPPA